MGRHRRHQILEKQKAQPQLNLHMQFSYSPRFQRRSLLIYIHFTFRVSNDKGSYYNLSR